MLDASVHLRETFSLVPPYLRVSHNADGLSDAPWMAEYASEQTRPFRALRVWMAFKTYGMRKHARLIEQNVAQAKHLVLLVEEAPELELLAPVALNVVCFRFRAEGVEEAALSQLNEDLLAALQESGVAAPSSTVLAGKFAIRVAITNHRSRREDFDLLVRETIRLGRELAEKPLEVQAGSEVALGA